MIGHPGHGDRLSGRGPALGQRDIQQLRRTAGIVIEQFVEVPHPIEQQDVRVLRLEAEILLHHRGVGVKVVRGGHESALSV